MKKDNFDQLASKFFESLTPNQPAYYSSEFIDGVDGAICPRGKKYMAYLETLDWKEVLREYLRRWIKGMQMLHIIDDDFTTGNSRPDQYSFSNRPFSRIAEEKFINQYKESLLVKEKKDDFLKITNYGTVRANRKLGFGKQVDQFLEVDFDFGLSCSKGKYRIKFKPKIHVCGDSGFYDHFAKLAKGDMLAEAKSFCKEPLLKTDLTGIDSYPDISKYNRIDQIGLIKRLVTWDTKKIGKNYTFIKSYVDGYKEAYEFVKSLTKRADNGCFPVVEYSEDLKTCTYKGKTYTAEEIDNWHFGKIPDSLIYISQGIKAVLYYKYGLIKYLGEYDYDKFREIKHNLHWLVENYHLPLSEEMRELWKKVKDK